jgi:hypothetical protein
MPDRYTGYTIPKRPNLENPYIETIQAKTLALTERFTRLYTTVKPLLEDSNVHTQRYVHNLLCQDMIERPVSGVFDVTRLNNLSRMIQKLDTMTEEIAKAWSESEITRYVRMKATDDWRRTYLTLDDFSIELQNVDWKKVGFVHWVLAGQPNLVESKIVQRMLITHYDREFHVISDDPKYYKNQTQYIIDLIRPSLNVRSKGGIIKTTNPDELFAEALSSRSPLKRFDVSLGLRFLDASTSRPVFNIETNVY